MQIKTRGGSRETDEKAETVKPKSSPESSAPVTTVTALAKYRITFLMSTACGGFEAAPESTLPSLVLMGSLRFPAFSFVPQVDSELRIEARRDSSSIEFFVSFQICIWIVPGMSQKTPKTNMIAKAITNTAITTATHILSVSL